MDKELRDLVNEIKLGKIRNSTSRLIEKYYDLLFCEQEEIEDTSTEIYIPLEGRPSGIFNILEEVIDLDANIREYSSYVFSCKY